METKPDKHEVLIVGAGPTGLAMAIDMARQGIPARVVDKSEQPAQHSQALVLQARTLEQFERYGIADEAVARGRALRRASFMSDGRKITSLTLDKIHSRYPFVLFLPQSETEALLLQHLARLGVQVERGTSLVSLTNNGDQMEAKLGSKNGNVEKTAFRWVVGCDGAHSAVREISGIPFGGNQVSLNFYLGDLELTGPDRPGDELKIYLHRGDVVFMGRLSDRIHRVIVAQHSQQGEKEQKKDLAIADFQQAMDAAGINAKAVSAEWMTPFRVSDRRAQNIWQGNIFLAGDASHIHSPVGGQGMNTGIQDVANLAWKIAAVKRGADNRLFDSYEYERGKVSERLLNATSTVLKAATTANPMLEKLRDALISMGSKLSYVQEQIAGFISETSIEYRDSPGVIDCGGDGALRAGDRAPNPDLIWRDGRKARLLDGLQSGKHLAVRVNSGGAAKYGALHAEMIDIKTEELSPHSAGEIEQLFGRSQRLAIVRPDGYLGFRGGDADEDRLNQYARTVGIAAKTGATSRREAS